MKLLRFADHQLKELSSADYQKEQPNSVEPSSTKLVLGFLKANQGIKQSMRQCDPSILCEPHPMLTPTFLYPSQPSF
jgi:hypothetical protein